LRVWGQGIEGFTFRVPEYPGLLFGMGMIGEVRLAISFAFLMLIYPYIDTYIYALLMLIYLYIYIYIRIYMYVGRCTHRWIDRYIDRLIQIKIDRYRSTWSRSALACFSARA